MLTAKYKLGAALLAGALALSPRVESAMRCGTRIIARGDVADKLLQFCGERNAYDLLGCDETRLSYAKDSIRAADRELAKIGVNEKNRTFLQIITEFLFETQLLYSK